MAMYARSTTGTLPGALAAMLALLPTLGAAEGPQTLRTEGGTITFRVAQQQGFFEKHGIKIQKEDSGTGAAMNARLGKGEIDVVDGGLDNGIAATLQGVDAVIVTGSSLAGQELVAQPGISSVKDLRGKTIAVDSTDMQAALVLKKMLAAGGLKPHDYKLKVVGANRLKAMRDDKQYAAAMLAGAQALLAQQEGFVSLGNSLDVVGPVTYHGVFVRRSWARDNADVLTRYIAAEIEAQRWILLPANKDKVVAFILKTSPEGTTNAMAEDVYREMVNGPGELTKDIRLEVPALQNFLKLRAEVEGSWKGSPPPAAKFYDSSYYYKALDLVSR